MWEGGDDAVCLAWRRESRGGRGRREDLQCQLQEGARVGFRAEEGEEGAAEEGFDVAVARAWVEVVVSEGGVEGGCEGVVLGYLHSHFPGAR